MVGLSINESTRTAASDGALSFSILVNNQRELTLSSAHSAVTGLLSAIRTAPEDFAKLLDAAADAVATQETAALKLVQPPWAPASQQTTEAIRAQLNAAFAQLLANARNQATQARIPRRPPPRAPPTRRRSAHWPPRPGTPGTSC